MKDTISKAGSPLDRFSQSSGLSPATAEKILQMDIIPDAKMILIAMVHNNLHETSFMGLDKILNCPLSEMDYSRLALSSDRINVNKVANKITLCPEWIKIVEENKNVQLQSRTCANCSVNGPNDKPRDSERSSPEAK